MIIGMTIDFELGQTAFGTRYGDVIESFTVNEIRVTPEEGVTLVGGYRRYNANLCGTTPQEAARRIGEAHADKMLDSYYESIASKK